MLARMQREAAFMTRLAEQPATEMEATLRERQQGKDNRRSRPRPGAYTPSGH